MNAFQHQRAPLLAGYFDSSIFQKKAQRLLVLQTGVAGMRHYLDFESESGKALLEGLVPGTELRLYREPDNEHDTWAVAVYTADEQKIGYITRFKCETIARLMDYGKKLTAVVDDPPPEPKDEVERRRTRAWSEDYRLPFSVYLEE